MDDYPWINDESRASIEKELIETFKEGLLRGGVGTDFIVDEEKFRFVREELSGYYPDALEGALPYVLICFLRFGAPNINELVALGNVVHFLNIKCYGYDGPDIHGIGERRDESVSLFSSRQAEAIRLWLEAVRGLGVLLPDSTDYADLAYAIAYWRRRSTTRARATSARNANATSDAYPWINDEARAPIEKELIEAFKAEVLKGGVWTDLVIDVEKFTSVREHLGGYFPDDLEWALPYVLIAFLRLGVPNVHELVALGNVVNFLNIRCYGYDTPIMRGLGEHQDESVSQFSSRQAEAIRLWLEAVRGLGIFFPDSTDYRDLTYAIAYWSRRSTGGEENGVVPRSLGKEDNANEVGGE